MYYSGASGASSKKKKKSKKACLLERIPLIISLNIMAYLNLSLFVLLADANYLYNDIINFALIYTVL